MSIANESGLIFQFFYNREIKNQRRRTTVFASATRSGWQVSKSLIFNHHTTRNKFIKKLFPFYMKIWYNTLELAKKMSVWVVKSPVYSVRRHRKKDVSVFFAPRCPWPSGLVWLGSRRRIYKGHGINNTLIFELPDRPIFPAVNFLVRRAFIGY